MFRSLRLGGTLLSLSLTALLMGATAGEAAGQAKVYNATEVTTPASIKNKSAAASAIERNYPSALQRLGGKVQLQFVVQEDGRVDPASVKVLVATVGALGEAATKAVQSIQFKPAEVDGQPVASIVAFPVVYAAR